VLAVISAAAASSSTSAANTMQLVAVVGGILAVLFADNYLYLADLPANSQQVQNSQGFCTRTIAGRWVAAAVGIAAVLAGSFSTLSEKASMYLFLATAILALVVKIT
jgi:hypothetical protein